MAKWLFLLTLLMNVSAHPNDAKSDALQAQNEAVRAMGQFNPARVLKDFTKNPPEAHLPIIEQGAGNDNELAVLGAQNAGREATSG